MKKILLFCCSLYVSSSYAILQGLIAATLATAPVTGPGAYHYCKAKKQFLENEDVKKKIEQGMFRPFVTGAMQGLVPPMNAIHLMMEAPALLFTNLERWEKYEPTVLDDERERARLTGFISALSLYATVPLAVKYCRR